MDMGNSNWRRWSRAGRVVLLILVATGILLEGTSALAASLSEQKTQIRRVNTYLKSAQRLARAKRSDDAIEMFAKAQTILGEVASEGVDPRLQRPFDSAKETLAEVHAKLTKAGLKLEELESMDGKLGSSPSRDARGGRFDQGDISFVRDVAPMLASKCGGCHIDNQRGGFNMATYRDLMRGSDTGDGVVLVGNGAKSRIVDVIVSGDMPRGGGEVTPQQYNLLAKWITQGAKFDGQSETTNLRNLRPGDGSPPPEPKPIEPPAKVARATGDETVSFALDVAPILSANCLGCHGLNGAASGLSVANFEALLKGGDGGVSLRAKNPDGSALLRRITGADTPQMPLRRPPLSAKEIQTIKTWIEEGATFDGPMAPASGVKAPIDRVTSLVRADRATPDELSAMRAETAKRTWRLAAPNQKPAKIDTDRFHIVGNLPEARLTEIGQQAELVADDLLKLFGHPKGEPLAKARITLFALGSRIDFDEFGLMVQKRETDRHERGATGFDIVDAYAAVQLGTSPEESDAPALAEQIAKVYLAERTQGRLPPWLLDGAGRVAAARAAPKDELVLAWREGLPSAIASLQAPDDFLKSKLPPRDAGILRYGFAEGLIRKPGKLHSVIADVAAGKELDAAFQRVFNYTPEQLAPLWVASVKRQR